MTQRVPELFRRLENYRWRCIVPTRFGDQDPNYHINNVAMARLFEEARIRFTRAVDVEGEIRNAPIVAASLKIDYLAEALYPLDATIGVGFARVGRTSWTMMSAAFDADQCLAVCEAVMVRAVDGKPDEIPASWRRQAVTFAMVSSQQG